MEIYDYKATIKRRREDIAPLYFDGQTAEEIAEDSLYSVGIIRRDIEYIESHPEEFLG